MVLAVSKWKNKYIGIDTFNPSVRKTISNWVTFTLSVCVLLAIIFFCFPQFSTKSSQDILSTYVYLRIYNLSEPNGFVLAFAEYAKLFYFFLSFILGVLIYMFLITQFFVVNEKLPKFSKWFYIITALFAAASLTLLLVGTAAMKKYFGYYNQFSLWFKLQIVIYALVAAGCIVMAVLSWNKKFFALSYVNPSNTAAYSAGGFNFCPHCGRALPFVNCNFCPDCGKNIYAPLADTERK